MALFKVGELIVSENGTVGRIRQVHVQELTALCIEVIGFCKSEELEFFKDQLKKENQND